jgi:hypothetical protein
MPKFLTRQEIYRMLQRESPENVYPDGAPSAYYSTADWDATASGIASAYENLETTYDNYWPMYANASAIAKWEIKAFGELLSGSLSLSEKQDLVKTRIQARKGLTKDDMTLIVKSVIGSDKLVELIEWGCGDGTWLIGVSELGLNTFLGGYNQSAYTGEDLCDKSASDFGLSEDYWDGMREEAYTYEVRIYDYVLTTRERTEIDEQLSIYEPARSQHIITDDLDSADMITA